MPSWPVILQDGSTVQLPTPYGFEHRIERPGAYEAELLLSPINERIQVLTYQARDLDALTADLLALARRNGYGKVWTKAPATDRHALEAAGFECEGHILGYYKGVDAASMTCFLSDERRFRPHREQEEQILAAALAGEGAKPATHLPDGYTTALFTDADAEELAALYREVFPTYPYPIDDPDYLRATASTHIAYRLVRNEAGRLVAAASAETNLKYRNSEMTDFAALPSERGKGLALFILRALEHDARERFGVRCHYTIARALSFGMLRTFHHAGYVLTGTLVNNCNIAGQFETMHLMCRPPGTD